ncbi:MAG: SIR2 family protein [Bacteroidales bacterium]|nr:SIR2 family protein [Bacteroidales bacterium]
MNLKELFNKTIFLIGAGASMDADCLSSSGMLKRLKEATSILDKPDENGNYSKYKDYQLYFKEIYDFIVASLNYQFSMKDSEYALHQNINVEDFVMVLKQIIDREYIVPYPLVGNWNDKIMKWELINSDNIFTEFLEFIVGLLKNEWTRVNQRKAKILLTPIRELLISSEAFKMKFFSLNYDLLLEETFGSTTENIIETGFTSKNIASEKIRVWNEDVFSDNNSKAKLHLYKLHGSINWEYDTDYELVKEKSTFQDGKEPLIIFGSANKMLSFDPFLFFLSEFRRNLSYSSLIIVIGYSFHDKYINNLLIQQLQQSTTRRMLIVDPNPMSKDEQEFVKKLETIQTIRTVNDLINFRKANPEKITIIKKTAKRFFQDYFSQNAKELKQLLKESSKEDIIF